MSIHANIIADTQFPTNIRNIKVKGKQLDALIHSTAVYALKKVNDPLCGDVGFVSRLLEVMPNSSRKETLKAWFMFYGKVQEKHGVVCFLKRKDITPENWEQTIDKADTNPFWMKPEKPAEKQLIEMDVEQAVVSLLKRLANADVLEHQEIFGLVYNALPEDTRAKVAA